MAKYVRNTLSQGVNPTGDHRIPPGAVVSVSDDEHKALTSIDGVENANEQDYRDYLGEDDTRRTGAMAQQELISSNLVENRIVSVSAPLQVVIGDDLAPYGPPTGELSTKKQEAEKDHAHRVAFADNEALGTVTTEDLKGQEVTASGNPNARLVHNAQAENKEVAESAASEFVEVLEDATATPADKNVNVEKQPTGPGDRPKAS